MALEEGVDLVELAVAVLEDVEGRLAAFLVGGVLGVELAVSRGRKGDRVSRR